MPASFGQDCALRAMRRGLSARRVRHNGYIIRTMLAGRNGAALSPFPGNCVCMSEDARKLMELTAEYLGGSKFAAEARGHRIICDQPVENGGADAGMTPPELLLASLATCAG